MKDKEKQIEEMAETIQSYSDIKQSYYDGEWHSVGVYNGLARTLYSKDFRIVNKDSVVLSMEEYEKLKHFENRVRSGVCLTQKEWFDFCNEDSNRRTCLRIEEREKERKETAEKIFNTIYDKLNTFEAVYEIDYESYVDDVLWEIAKQFGVEIKE